MRTPLEELAEALRLEMRGFATNVARTTPRLLVAGVEAPACRRCGCTEERACLVGGSEGLACMWVERDLCSACASVEELLAHPKGLAWLHVLSALLVEDLAVGVNRPPKPQGDDHACPEP